MRRRAALVLSGLVLLAGATGCCGTPCADDRLPQTRRLLTPYDTIDYFRYCVRNECWGEVWETLSASTQAQVRGGKVVFQVFFDGVKLNEIPIPRYQSHKGDETLVELIHRAAIENVLEVDPGREWTVALSYQPPGRPPAELVFEEVPIVLEGERWVVDLSRLQLAASFDRRGERGKDGRDGENVENVENGKNGGKGQKGGERLAQERARGR